VVVLLDLNVLAEHVAMSGPVLSILNFSLRTIFWFLMAKAAFLVGIAVGETIISSPKIDPNGIHAGLIKASWGFIGVVAAAIIIFHGLSILGISVMPLLAGLGVGGLAVALAARPTLENLIGGFMILLDRPYRIGQRVQVKGYYGDVEKIGWRSTRIRLLTGHQTIVPNEEMARLDIENIGRRPYIRRKANITITYGTPLEKIEKAVEIIEDILKDHEGMDPELPPKVYFNEFNSDSLNIVMYYWYHPPEFWDFYAFTQNVNLQIMREFEKEGIQFAFPTTTNDLTQADGQPLHINLGNELQLNSQNKLRKQ
jgi:MscS family membrane protein